MKNNLISDLTKAKAIFQQRAILAAMAAEDSEPTPICEVTGTYCNGQHCDEYGCAKKAGFYDED